jgi:molybdate transport system substrate-binding protein
MKFRIHLALLGLFVFAGVSWCQERILVAAASDMKFAMDSLAQTFRRKTPGDVVDITYGSSGKLTEQILNGAPFDLFFSADIGYTELLKSREQASSEIYPYAKGHIVLWSRNIDPNDRRMKTLLDPSIARIAIANPQHAPYGRRAVECLNYYGLMEAVKSKLVYGQNVAQAAQFAISGAADAAIIGLSAIRPIAMQQSGGAYYLIPEESHEPLVQGAVITRHGGGKELADAFFEFIKSPAAIAILSYYGFSKPD